MLASEPFDSGRSRSANLDCPQVIEFKYPAAFGACEAQHLIEICSFPCWREPVEEPSGLIEVLDRAEAQQEPFGRRADRPTTQGPDESYDDLTARADVNGLNIRVVQIEFVHCVIGQRWQ
jgi:hypothetical protein